MAVKRRAIARGAAWSVPVIAVSAAAPARAASCTNSLFADEWAPTATGLADTAKVTDTFVVPGVVGSPVQIEFDIAGGAGGGSIFAGSGARVTGVIYTVGGATVDIVAGQGGYAQANGQFNNNTGFTPGSFAGGQGFGNGGSVPGFASVVAPDLYNNGGSGGGGSAIFVNGTLVAVAGGGGGMARGIFTVTDPSGIVWTQGAPIPAKAGNGGTNAGIADLTVALASNTALFARGGNGSVTTAAGTGSATFAGGTTLTSLTGIAGGAANALGANGGNGIAVNNTTRTGGGYFVTSGGGGGGYTGGGSGGGLIHTVAAPATTSGLAVGGGGGGGGNYVDLSFFPSGNPQPVQSLAGNESSSNTTRSPGWVRVEVFNCI